jgi:hypothetical protein
MILYVVQVMSVLKNTFAIVKAIVGQFAKHLKIDSLLSAAFDNLRIRLGGSLQDRVVYDVGTNSPCSPFTNVSNGLFGFSAGCLSMDRWDKLNDLFQQTG